MHEFEAEKSLCTWQALLAFLYLCHAVIGFSIINNVEHIISPYKIGLPPKQTAAKGKECLCLILHLAPAYDYI